MYEQIGHAFYHVLIVIFPVLIYYLLVIRDSGSIPKLHSGKLFIMMLVILILTMSFPLEYANGFRYDFRIIPIFVGFLYIGFFHGIATIGVMLLYLYLQGEPRIFHQFINYAIISIILHFFTKKFSSLRLSRKLIILTTISGFVFITRGITLVNNNETEQIFVMLVFSVITNITLLLVVLIFENLNQQLHLQREIRRTEKMNVISQLAASVAHEVRNPLTTVSGFMQLMNQDDNITEKQRSYIEITLSELNRAQSIINDYLSLSKPNNGSTQLVDIGEELSKTVKLMTSYSNIQNIDVQTSIEDSLFIMGSKDEMKQVFINMMKNAIEAVGNGGFIEIKAYKKDQHIIVKIMDNGPGMTKEQLTKIGTPFYSTKEVGTGIGLTICYQIIQHLKGTINVESTIGEGTTFIIKLPYKGTYKGQVHCQRSILKSSEIKE